MPVSMGKSRPRSRSISANQFLEFVCFQSFWDMAITLHITDYSGESRGGVGGCPSPPLIFRTFWGPKSRKIWRRSPLISRTGSETGLCSLNLHSFVVSSHIGCASTAKFGRYILSIPSWPNISRTLFDPYTSLRNLTVCNPSVVIKWSIKIFFVCCTQTPHLPAFLNIFLYSFSIPRIKFANCHVIREIWHFN